MSIRDWFDDAKNQIRENKIACEPTPYAIRFLIIVITFFTPFAILPWTYFPGVAAVIQTGEVIVAIFWIFFPVESTPSGLNILNYPYIPFVAFLGIFNLLFAIQLDRYCKSKATLNQTTFSGVLSLLIPSVFAILNISHILSRQVYIGPVPIQLLVGLLVIRLFDTRYLENPW